MRTTYLLLLAICAAIILSACGGGNHSSTTPSNPVFTSTPGAAASQGVAYSYQLSANDPSGGTLTFALTAAPAGATLTGSTVNWTPTPAQSRVSNSFTVTASAASGGTATQSWSVTPTGTVTVTTASTYWTAAGQESYSSEFPQGVAAAFPDSDGSLTIIANSYLGGGIFNIPSVPGGYYWLIADLRGESFEHAYWTSSSSIDLGADIPGLPWVGAIQQNTTFNFNIAGLDPTSTASIVSASTDIGSAQSFGLDPAAEATTVSGTFAPTDDTDWSKADTLFLGQYEPVSLGSLNLLALGPSMTLSTPGFVDSATNTVSETLQPSLQASVNVTVPGSQWAQMFSTIGPSSAQGAGSWLSVTAEPFITGHNQSPTRSSNILNDPVNVPLVVSGVTSSSSGTSPLSPDDCLNGSSSVLGPFGIFSPNPAILTDEDLGTLNYGDPYPEPWTRAIAFCQTATVTLPGNGLPYRLPFGLAVPPSSSPSLAPLALPVVNPTINGNSLFTSNTLDTTVVTLSWSAPQGTAPYGYLVSGWSEQSVERGIFFTYVGQFGTAKTSVTLPPLVANETYVFFITTLVDAAANMETSPLRSALPTGFANVVSAPITISSSATPPVIHGDAELFKKLMSRRLKMTSPPFLAKTGHQQ